jgi:hypothetical protein
MAVAAAPAENGTGSYILEDPNGGRARITPHDQTKQLKSVELWSEPRLIKITAQRTFDGALQYLTCWSCAGILTFEWMDADAVWDYGVILDFQTSQPSANIPDWAAEIDAAPASEPPRSRSSRGRNAAVPERFRQIQ